MKPLRVLIVRIGAMGDVLHAMPAVAALRERHPDWFIGRWWTAGTGFRRANGSGAHSLGRRNWGLPNYEGCCGKNNSTSAWICRGR